MARTCNDCGYYTQELEDACPKCNSRLQVTFLPPRGLDMTPPAAFPKPLAPGSPSYPMPGFRGSYDLFEIILRNRFALTLVAIPLLAYGFWMSSFSASPLQSKYRAIRLGMSPDEVHKILYADSKFASSRSRVSLTGEAQMTYTEGPIKIIVYFRNGRVVDKRLTGLKDGLTGEDLEY